LSEVFLLLPFPPTLRPELHSPLSTLPCRVPHHLSAVRPVGRTDSPELSGPFNDITRAGPVWSELSMLTPVPLAGFLNLSAGSWLTRASWPCFVPQPSWDPPFRVFPSQKSRTPLGATCSPAVLHQHSVTHSPGSYHHRFRRLPRSHTRSPGSPGDCELPFGSSEDSPPGHPGLRTAEPSRPTSFVYSEALFLLRVRSRRTRLPCHDGRYSPGLLPLQNFLRPRLGPSNPPGPRPVCSLSPGGSNARPEGPLGPSGQVKPSPAPEALR